MTLSPSIDCARRVTPRREPRRIRGLAAGTRFPADGQERFQPRAKHTSPPPIVRIKAETPPTPPPASPDDSDDNAARGRSCRGSRFRAVFGKEFGKVAESW